jgi:Rrf2 family protein
MQLVNRDTDYAFRALQYLASTDDSVISVTELAEALEIPHPFLRRVLQKMARRGFLRSSRGRGGGFQLAAAPESISLRELIAVFQKPLDLGHCYVRGEICADVRTCRLHRKLKALERTMNDELESTTLASLMKPRPADAVTGGF